MQYTLKYSLVELAWLGFSSLPGALELMKLIPLSKPVSIDACLSCVN